MILLLGDYAPESKRKLSKNFKSILCNVRFLVLNYEGTSKKAITNAKLAKGYVPIVDDELIIDALALGVTVICSLTNNHSTDYGLTGYINTVERLEGLGCKVIGPSVNDLTISPNIEFIIDGSKIRITSAADFNVGEARIPYFKLKRPRFNDAFRSINKGVEKSDINIFIYHSGVEFINIPNPSLVRNIKKMMSTGINFSIVHHQHVSLPIIKTKCGLIAYGLGNMAFDCKGHDYFFGTKTGLAVNIKLDLTSELFDVIDNGSEIELNKKVINYSANIYANRVTEMSHEWNLSAYNRLFNKDVVENIDSNVSTRKRSGCTVCFRIKKIISMIIQSAGRDVLLGAFYYFVKNK